ncbi:hypothetical protein GCM10025734_03810 [Kitasatospora paranensis]
MGEHQQETASTRQTDTDPSSVDKAVAAEADRVRRALESDDAGRVAGPGAKPGNRPKPPSPPGHGAQDQDEPPQADAGPLSTRAARPATPVWLPHGIRVQRCAREALGHSPCPRTSPVVSPTGAPGVAGCEGDEKSAKGEPP